MSTAFKKLIEEIHKELGIPSTYGEKRKLKIQNECLNLRSAGVDIFDREISMEETTLSSWTKMQSAASKDGIELKLVSAYRSVEYQKNLLLNKLNKGLKINDILKVNAAPGYSEHHSGKALDLTCPESECLEESFELTLAFAWLERYAEDYAFKMSFPRSNDYGLLYEPWHWCHQE
ncbi:MAG: D-alanyl-D-alanine carboxypeptidase family protein [Gammaproteobacteria bacterium]|nr:D-alanyl-D-alanine carboxypeptidase family protein [Gammaproteobacteria bacterium]